MRHSTIEKELGTEAGRGWKTATLPRCLLPPHLNSSLARAEERRMECDVILGQKQEEDGNHETPKSFANFGHLRFLTAFQRW